MRVWKATMPARCVLWSRSVSHAEFWNSAAFATMPAATQARQVRLWGQEGASYGQEGRMEEWSQEILGSVHKRELVLVVKPRFA